MKILDTTYQPSFPEMKMKQSILHEAALGIAAVTNKPIHETLDDANIYWENHRPFSKKLEKELDGAEKNNTWKVVLDLLQEQDFEEIEAFQKYIDTLSEAEFRMRALPYLGPSLENISKRAAAGDKQAIELMKESINEHAFFSSLVIYVCVTPIDVLRDHIINLITLWYEEIIIPNKQALTEVLSRDIQAKQNMKQQLSPTAFIQWVLDYNEYEAEPGVTEIILIPQVTYRPWVIFSERKNRKIFYYPVDDESLHERIDPYRPHFKMIQRYKALGDENRLKMLKLLSEKDRTLKELTEAIGMGKTTVHHHVTLLRSARLVRVEGSKYSLQRHLLGVESKQLLNYLNIEEME
ncbi:ArsR/SmtB family transcription factor [Virgibacillus oceani]